MLRRPTISARRVGSGADFFLGTGRFRCAIAASRSHSEQVLLAAKAVASTASISAFGRRVARVFAREEGSSIFEGGSENKGGGTRWLLMSKGPALHYPRYGRSSSRSNLSRFQA